MLWWVIRLTRHLASCALGLYLLSGRVGISIIPRQDREGGKEEARFRKLKRKRKGILVVTDYWNVNCVERGGHCVTVQRLHGICGAVDNWQSWLLLIS